MESVIHWKLIEEWYETYTVDYEWEQEYNLCGISDKN